uniref:CSON002162 protein n=1 Tax=Culicoides sonorensis TaxID=179676 RepID=A0A336MIS6_CULSO
METNHFDRYYKSLRPRLKQKDEYCNNTGTNYFMASPTQQQLQFQQQQQQPHSFEDELIVNCRNIWFREFWSQHNKCEFDKTAYGAKVNTKTSNTCDGSEKIQFEQEGLVPFVVDAVYAIAHAIDNMIREKCKDVPFNDCEEIQPAPMGYELLKHIHNVSFVGRQNTSIRFNKDGDAYGFYNIYQYQYLEDKQKYDYVPIGTWKERLDLQAENLRWDTGEMPRSICSDPCPVGHVRNYQDQCCWSCVKCREDAYVHNDTCMVCDPGWAPNDLKNGCDKLTPEVIDWLSPWALVPIIFSSIGILFTLFTTAVFIKYNRTPVIMASGRELCYVLLSGILSCYAMSFIILARPTVQNCAILRIGLGISLSICYSAIFTKTNRISRIFNRGVKSVQRPIYTSPLSQIAISFDAYVHNDTCMVCDPGWAPNDLKNGCDKLTPEVIDWLSPWALVPIIFSSIGILFTLFTTAVFIKFNRTPVIMASGRELCYVLLSGILSCYAMSFIILARPTVQNCAILRIGLGISLSICYSAIFTKTNRISRIFNRGVKSVQRPIYTSPLSQIAISFGIVSIQLIGTIGWLVYEKPDIKEIHPYPLTAVLTCRVSTFSLMMSLIYNIILIVLCTLYAFKTRKIPENFNEAKYIGFTMYSTCIVWLAFIPIYFGTNNDYKIQISSLCMCLNISASVELGCLFLPKVYLVIFQPYKNVRPGTNGNQMGASDPSRPIHSMRFAPPKSQTMQSMTSVSKSASSPKTMQRSITDDQISVITPSVEEKSSTNMIDIEYVAVNVKIFVKLSSNIIINKNLTVFLRNINMRIVIWLNLNKNQKSV